MHWHGLLSCATFMVIHMCLVETTHLHIPSCYCFHISVYWVSSAAPAERRNDTDTMNEHLPHSQTHTHAHTHKQTKGNLSEISPSVSGEFRSRAVWSRWGQTVARHPEELPLYLRTATSCNLLLRDKTKLTEHFTADLADLSDLVHQLRLSFKGTCVAGWSWQVRLIVIIHQDNSQLALHSGTDK